MQRKSKPHRLPTPGQVDHLPLWLVGPWCCLPAEKIIITRRSLGEGHGTTYVDGVAVSLVIAHHLLQKAQELTGRGL